MRWLRVYQQVAQDHRAEMGETPSQQLGDGVAIVLGFLSTVVCLGALVLIAGGR